MPPPPPLPTEKATKPWPSYFLVRTTGQIVPLVALDELPAGVEIVGVPRALELEDTIGMLNLGLEKTGGKQYFVTVDKDLSIEVKGGG